MILRMGQRAPGDHLFSERTPPEVAPARAGAATLRREVLRPRYAFEVAREFTPVVYIITDKPDGRLYIGSTTDLTTRIWQHKIGAVAGYSRRYNLKRLVWYELHATMEEAALRERRMKKWNRAWKVARIEQSNPTWGDLYEDLA